MAVQNFRLATLRVHPDNVLNPDSGTAANRPGSQRLAMPTADTLPVVFLTVTAADEDENEDEKAGSSTVSSCTQPISKPKFSSCPAAPFVLKSVRP